MPQKDSLWSPQAISVDLCQYLLVDCMIRFNESAWITLQTQIDFKTNQRDQRRNHDKRPYGSLLGIETVVNLSFNVAKILFARTK